MSLMIREPPSCDHGVQTEKVPTHHDAAHDIEQSSLCAERFEDFEVATLENPMASSNPMLTRRTKGPPDVTILSAIISCYPYFHSVLEDWVHEDWEVTEEPQWMWEVIVVEALGYDWELVEADDWELVEANDWELVVLNESDENYGGRRVLL
ncbi:hypothetical protein BDD12DRAFT_892035 [Trichophaea hybrida]|nr:hypothetical protein BDD12DRAFT_892035 [Trichophaea hybrida]